MTGRLLIAMTMLAAGRGEGPAPAADRSPDRAAYEAARKQAGSDASAQIRLALWCEQHGMSAERMKHLAAAALHDPSNALARGLMGLVDHNGKWERPEDIAREAKEDPKRKALMKEYLERRARTPDKADEQWKLAAWCDQNGLKEQAVAHYHAVLRLDPRRDAAWRHLGFKKAGGRWVKPEQQEAARREAEEQGRANKHWKPILERCRSGLSSRDRARRAEAEASLATVTDPRAVPVIWSVFVSRGAGGQKTAVRVLGQIDTPGASRALAMLALSSKSPEARGEAGQILRRRDPRDFAPILVGMIRDPVQYEVKRVQGPGKPGELIIKDGSTNRRRIYTPLSEPNVAVGPNDMVVAGPDGLPVVQRFMGYNNLPIMMPGTAANLGMLFGLAPPTPPALTAQRVVTFEKLGIPAAQSQQLAAAVAGPSPPAYQNQIDSLRAFVGMPAGNSGGFLRATTANYLQIPVGDMMLDAQRSAQVAQQQLNGDVQAIEAYNAPIRAVNREARRVLSEAAGVDQGDDRSAWTKWLTDLFGYALAAQKASPSETTVVEQVPLDYQPQAPPISMQSGIVGVRWQHACFAAGTPVRTLVGPRPIESIRAGDLVLTQNPKSGELKYEAVVTVYHNPPNDTYRVTMEGDESVVATGIHRLWVAGKGWIMTRDLKPGDVLRSLGGVAAVKSVEKDEKQPVFNLQVAEGESYFVGRAGVLAHDNSTINPVPEPFDSVTTSTEAASSGRPAKAHSMLGR